MVSIMLVMALPMGIRIRDPLNSYHLLRSYQLLVFALVLGRWTFALLKRERNYGWVFYTLLPVAATEGLYRIVRL